MSESANPGGSQEPLRSDEQKLTEQACGKTHLQFFVNEICIGTVRVEYADDFREIVKNRLASVQNKGANRSKSE